MKSFALAIGAVLLVSVPLEATCDDGENEEATAGIPVSGSALGTPARPTFGGSVLLGISSFSERYSIVEKDTVDVLTEVKFGFNLHWRRRLTLEGYLEWDNRLITSENATRNLMRVGYLQYFSPTLSMRLLNEATVKVFQENSAFTYSNDFFQNRLSLELRGRPNASTRIGIRGELDTIFFERRSDFDYDFTRGDGELSLEQDFASGGYFRLAAGYGRQFVPDSTEIDYERIRPSLEVRHYFGWSSRIGFSMFVERRLYSTVNAGTDSSYSVRPDFTNYDIRGDFKIGVGSFLAFVGGETIETIDYSEPNEIYFNSVRSRASLGMELTPSPYVTLGVVPHYTLLRSNSEPAEEYDQTSLEFRVELFPIGKGWVDLTYELGRRDYRVDPGNEGSLTDGFFLYSDLFFHRLGLFASYDLSSQLAANLFASYEPVRHVREIDDTTALLLTADLTIRF